jgi:hypothetical protein
MLILILIIVTILGTILILKSGPQIKHLMADDTSTVTVSTSGDHKEHFYAEQVGSSNKIGCQGLVVNGSFEFKKHIKGYDHSSVSSGVSIVELLNPGNSVYVLSLSPSELNYEGDKPCLVSKYSISISVEASKFYQLFVWVRDVKETSECLFSLLFFSSCGKRYRLDTIGTNVMSSQNESGESSISGWQRRSVIFQVPAKAGGMMSLTMQYCPKRGHGTRYITGVQLINYYPQLSCYPVPDILSFFLSIMHITNWDSSRSIWKDLTSNNRDATLSSSLTSCKTGISLNKVRISGKCCCDLNITPLNFSLGWSIKFNTLDCKGNVVFRLDTSLENNNTILIIFKKDSICCSYSQIVVKYLSHRYVFNAGYTNYLATYIMQVDEGIVSIYKDAVKLTEAKGQKQLLTKAEHHCFFANKPFLINPLKCTMDAVIYVCFMHCRVLTNVEIVNIYYYFTFIFGNYFDKKTYACLINGICKAPEDKLLPMFPFKPFTEMDIITPSKEQHIKNQKQQIINKHDLEQCKYNEKIADTKLKHLEVTCEGDAVQQKSIQETQELLQALVKAFNAKENDKSKPPCKKTSYRISKALGDSQDKYHVIRTVSDNASTFAPQ